MDATQHRRAGARADACAVYGQLSNFASAARTVDRVAEPRRSMWRSSRPWPASRKRRSRAASVSSRGNGGMSRRQSCAAATSRIRMCAARFDTIWQRPGRTDRFGTGSIRPRVVNDQMAVDATRIDVALAGPDLKAAGAVKSVLQPEWEWRDGRSPATQLPSMFKQDQTGERHRRRARLPCRTRHGPPTRETRSSGRKRPRSRAQSIVLDDKTGDLTAGGGVTTVTVRDSLDKNKKHRTRPIDCDRRGFPVRGGRPPRHLHRQSAHEQP